MPESQSPKSPLDELRIPADKVWEKVLGGEMPSAEDLAVIVRNERAQREAWLKKDAKKREEKDK